MSAEERVIEVEVDVDLIILADVPEAEREKRRPEAFVIEVRTPAGFEARLRVHPKDKVEKVAKQAEKHFIHRGELASGNYRLEKLVHGKAEPLVPSATLKESGVHAGTVCVLVVADPQVDG